MKYLCLADFMLVLLVHKSIIKALYMEIIKFLCKTSNKTLLKFMEIIEYSDKSRKKGFSHALL